MNPPRSRFPLTRATPSRPLAFAVSAALALVLAPPLPAAALFATLNLRIPMPANPQSVAVADLDGDGQPDMVLADGSAVGVLLGDGSGAFGPRADVGAGAGPAAVAIADLNGDGRLDLVVANRSGNTVSILLGNGDGTFAAHVDYATGAGPAAVTIADVNGDGKRDLAVANTTDNTVSVLLGNGDGTFAAHVDVAVGSQPDGIAAGDLNGDGKPDLVVANNDMAGAGFGGSVSVLLGHGDGTFAAQTLYATGWAPTALALADLNHDGKLDVVTSNTYGGGSPAHPLGNVSVLLGQGDGTLAAHVDYTVQEYVGWMALGDFNLDGNLDVVVTSQGAGPGNSKLSILPGRGDGTLGPRSDIGLGLAIPGFVGVADLNRDGRADLLAADRGQEGTGLILWYGNGDGTFGKLSASYAVTTGAATMAIADLNGDGRPDLVAGGSSRSYAAVLLNLGNGTFGPEADVPTAAPVGSVTIGDLNGDGVPDLAIVNGANLSVALGHGDGTFGPRTDYPLAPLSFYANTEAVIGDLDGDGHPDLAVASGGNGRITLLFGHGDGTFAAPVSLAMPGAEILCVAAGDLNGDGRLDLVAGDAWPPGNLAVRLGTGSGAFAAAASYAEATGVDGLALADLDGDGKLDVVTSDYNQSSGVGAASVFLGHGDGTLAARTDATAGLNPFALDVVDLDGDGKPDALVANNQSRNISAMLGRGDGTLGNILEYGTHEFPSSVLARDLDGDGRPELIVGGGHVSVYANLNPQIPTAVTISALEPVVTAGMVALRWRISEMSGPVTVFRSAGGAWAPIANLAVDASGRVAYEDRSVVAGGRYGYRLVSGGATGGEVWVTVPGVTLALEGARPNPAAGAPLAAFSLPDAAPAELALLDVTGRVLATREVGALGAGRHVVAIGDGAKLRPGVYWLRLTRGAETRTGKAAIVR